MIHIIARLRVLPERREQFLGWCRRLVEITRSEAGTLVYEYHYDAASDRCLVIETYRDIESFDSHLVDIGTEAMAGQADYVIEHLDVCGDISPSQKAMFASLLQDSEGGLAKVMFYQPKAATRLAAD
jgi:quinol monooxygenase YgiN